MESLSSKIRFSDEQAMLLESAVAFCREQSPVSAVRALLASDQGFERRVWDQIVELGWPGMAIPERWGGSGLTLAEVATVCEPMGRHLLATPLVSGQLFIQGLLAGGSDSMCAAVLPRLVSGAIATVALFERDGDWDLAALDCKATRSGESVRLTGGKTLVCDAAVADYLLVSVQLAGAPALVLLQPGDVAASRLHRETIIDETRRSYALDLEGLTVSAGALITGDKATAALAAVQQAGLLLAAAEAAGGIAGALDVIVAYLNLRTTFGRKIGSYQSLKHPSAEILVGLERARSHVYHAATLLAAGEDAQVALSMAKVEAGDTFAFAGDRAVQFHGGFGFTYECDAQLYLRRALWQQYTFGDAAHHRARLADLLLTA